MSLHNLISQSATPVLVACLLFTAGCEQAKQEPASQAVAGQLTSAMVNDVIAVSESTAASEFSVEQESKITVALKQAFAQQPQKVLEALQPYLSTAAGLAEPQAGQSKALLLDQLFTKLTHDTVLEYLAPNGAAELPTNPSELVTLAEQRLGDFSAVTEDLLANQDVRGYIFTNRAPASEDIENAILTLHDLALTNKLAGSANATIGASFQAAAW
ncbi:hypothetical protein [Halioxenophilus aromaticivorans]|uniref:Lipoprotein n=1 Tax=Halioxenophilus aromaticivorans TaxID=1306992 RepID=A0AAV3U960_9ALTE